LKPKAFAGHRGNGSADHIIEDQAIRPKRFPVGAGSPFDQLPEMRSGRVSPETRPPLATTHRGAWGAGSGAVMTDYDNYIPPGEFSCRADSRRPGPSTRPIPRWIDGASSSATPTGRH
jgi:hypothetical protein